MAKQANQKIANFLDSIDIENTLPEDQYELFNKMTEEFDNYLTTEQERLTALNEDNSDEGQETYKKAIEEFYAECEKRWENYSKGMHELEYDFILIEEEVQFIRKHIIEDMRFSHENIFMAQRLYETWLKTLSVKPKPKGTNFAITVRASVMLFSLLENVYIKGIGTADYLILLGLLQRCGNISKIYDKIETTAKSLAEKINNIQAGLDEETKEEIEAAFEQAEAENSESKVLN